MTNLATGLFLSASLLSPFKNLMHFGEVAPADQRVQFTLHTMSQSFADLNIDGQT